MRPARAPIKGFGGVSSGPEPLKKVHTQICEVLEANVGMTMTVRTLADIANYIGICMVSGNVRRTAEILIGQPTDEYLDLKNYDVNPERAAFGWTSNNSVYANPVESDWRSIADRIKANGEPGVIILDNIQSSGRTKDAPTFADKRATLVNPCAEQTLKSFELCNLVEVFLNNVTSDQEFFDLLKYAFLYAKIVTLAKTYIPKTNRVLLRNRRIGTSVSGIAQYVQKHGVGRLGALLDKGYTFIKELDVKHSAEFAVPMSIKVTTVKPLGTISILAGATAGVHFPELQYIIRRVRLSKMSKLVKALSLAGYHIEPAAYDEEQTVVA